MRSTCRSLPPRTVDEHNDARFTVRDGQALAHVNFEEELGRRASAAHRRQYHQVAGQCCAVSDDLALKLAEKRVPRNRGEASEATSPADTAAAEFARSGDLKGGRARAAAIECRKEAVEPNGWLSGLMPDRRRSGGLATEVILRG